jgi:hypothetical protein
VTGWPAGDIPVKAIAEAVLQRARRTGLLWRLRPATVTSTAAGAVRVRLDGDTSTIRATSMIGPVADGARVMVLITPPAGQHIVGWAGTPAPGGGPTALAWADTDSEPVSDQQTVLAAPVVLRARTAYRVELGGGAVTSTGAARAHFRLQCAATGRRLAQELATFGGYRGDGGSVIALDGTVCYIRRLADTDLDTVVELTLQSSTGTSAHTAAAGRSRYLQITACGEAARYPHAATVH